ncbi:hypothetical protein CLV51_1049 [Chitinophaga niastensis]|uniref:Uncharacterized protein n=2 Tax=Chitinophaga niastensis TaxID=536980 RepID=A0A2P8HGF0_CHINA|nr:hypothetical protein CLV51_1049 [Chitinophaga niastensis]
MDDFLYCAGIVKGNGDVFILKIDGAREVNHYTVIISFPTIEAEMIRADDKSMKIALFKVLEAYILVRKES